MQLIKNLFKYLLILIGVAAFAIAAMASIMFFFPNVSLFGYHYQASHKNHILMLNTDSISKVKVVTNNYNINIRPNDNLTNPDVFRIVIKDDYVGFTNSKEKELFVNGKGVSEFSAENIENYQEATGEYIFDLTELTGIIAYGSSSVDVYVPTNFTTEYYLETHAGKINFQANPNNLNEKVHTDNITIKVNSSRGDFDIEHVNIEPTATVDITNYLGRTNISNEIGGSVKISSKTGSFYFSKINQNLIVSGENPYVSFNELGGYLKFTSPSGLLDAGIVNGNVKVETSNGTIKIRKIVNLATVDNSYGDVVINQIGENEMDDSYSVSITGGTGTIQIGQEQVYDNVSYKGVYGKISSIITTTGRVVLENVYSPLTLADNETKITTTKGSVTVNFADTNTPKVKFIVVSTESGAIKLNNIYGEIEAQTQNSATITATFKALYKVANFTTDEGAINLKLAYVTNAENRQLVLNMLNKANKVNLEIGDFAVNSFDENSKDQDGYYTSQHYFPTEITSSDNVITAKTNNGRIKISD